MHSHNVRRRLNRRTQRDRVKYAEVHRLQKRRAQRNRRNAEAEHRKEMARSKGKLVEEIYSLRWEVRSLVIRSKRDDGERRELERQLRELKSRDHWKAEAEKWKAKATGRAQPKRPQKGK